MTYLRDDIVRSALKAGGRVLKRRFAWAIDVFAPKCPDEVLPVDSRFRRVLLVRGNFRIGNTLLVTSLLPVLHARFPEAAIDMLTGDSTLALLDGLSIGHVHSLSRKFVRKPWRFLAFVRGLRRSRYDVAIDGAMGSFSGALYSWLSGAKWRIGARGRNDRLLNVRLDLPRCTSVYQMGGNVAAALGVRAAAWPLYWPTNKERDDAEHLIAQWRIGRMLARTIIGVFIGGHGRKRYPSWSWLQLLAILDSAKVPVLAFVGPEDSDFLPELARRQWKSVGVVKPGPLRHFAALLSQTRVLITPDSGPMHLAAALDVPVLAILRSEKSRFYVPPGPENYLLNNPTPTEIVAKLLEHPACRDLRDRAHLPALPKQNASTVRRVE